MTYREAVETITEDEAYKATLDLLSLFLGQIGTDEDQSRIMLELVESALVSAFIDGYVRERRERLH